MALQRILGSKGQKLTDYFRVTFFCEVGTGRQSKKASSWWISHGPFSIRIRAEEMPLSCHLSWLDLRMLVLSHSLDFHKRSDS